MPARRSLLVAGPLLVVAAALVSAVTDAASGLWPLDFGSLGQAGDRLLSPAWRGTFADPSVQVGPLWLAVLGILRDLARALDMAFRPVFAVATEVGVAVGVMWAARSVSGSTAWSAVAGAVVIVGGVGWSAYISGHPEELFVALLWLGAGIRARADKAASAGILLGAAIALKPTGALGLPVLLLLQSQRTRRAGVFWAAGLALAAYLPFLAFGTVRTFEYRWAVDSALLRLVLDPERGFPWWLRVVQGAVVVGVGALVVARMKRSRHVVWCAPMAIVAVRISIDPQPHNYFWLPFETLGIVGAASLAPTEGTVGRLLLGAGTFGLLLARYLPPLAGFLVHIGVGVALVLRAWANDEDRASDPAPPGRFRRGGEQAVAGSNGAV